MKCPYCGYEPSNNSLGRWLLGIVSLPTFLVTGLITLLIPVVIVVEGGLPIVSIIVSLVLFGGIAVASGFALYGIYQAQDWKPTEDAPIDWGPSE